MVYIKKLEIYGFKSFGFRNTIISFEKGLVAVTGPNGSGKSNILDAILFAIGENSPKALRVNKLQSLFHDSQNSSHRLIRVSLTFDNADRGIPIDSDLVILTREMEGQTGDSQYHLNGKKVSKTTIVELLEVVMAAPNKINIVQQGMITRISELNVEERRKIIEDIVGLSYFDEKKTEALKQLEESDRRLEVALARMGEIRRRIDELEIERNDQLRYEQLESELKRFKAIQLSNAIISIRNKLELQNRLLESNSLKVTELFKQIEEIQSQIQKVDSEKLKFIQEIDIANRSKAQIGSRIANIVYESERMKAIMKESEQRCLQIEKRISSIDLEKQNMNRQLDDFRHQADQNKTVMNYKSSKIIALKTDLGDIDNELEKLTRRIAIYARIRDKLEYRYDTLLRIKNDLDVSFARLEEKVRSNEEKLKANKLNAIYLKNEVDNGTTLLADIHDNLKLQNTKLEAEVRTLQNLKTLKSTFEKELKSSSILLNRADNVTTKYEAKSVIAKNARNEDFAIAELMKGSEKFGIKGLVHHMMTWDKKYEKSVFAAGSEWMKAFVVDNVKSMISIAEYAKTKKLPRLKIIPLDIIKYVKYSKIPYEDVSIIGNLADFVYSDFKELSNFIFGNTFIVRGPTAAYILSKQGYRAVSVDGELFEPKGACMSLDFGSKISDLTKAILLSSTVDILRGSLETLRTTIETKKNDLEELILKINCSESEKIKIEERISNLNQQISSQTIMMGQVEKKQQQLVSDNALFQSERNTLTIDVDRVVRRLSILTASMKKVLERIGAIDDSTIRNELDNINSRRNLILKSIEEVDFELRQTITSSAGMSSKIEISLERMKGMEDEKVQLISELSHRRTQTKELEIKLKSIESELISLRDQEQQIIDSSGRSYSIVQEYEKKLKLMNENERKLNKEYNTIEKDNALLRKDILDQAAQESRLTNDLHWLGYKSLLETFDVDTVIKELTDEYEAIKTRINLRADESYVQVIEGYRSMSNRKNHLETERNSIVLFIEEIVKEKENVFMDAFNKVDNDIRKTFSQVTGGVAWLEIENVEDVFSSGIMLMVQFPGKQGRESTALSGGEKTMAATIFLLAIQALKPSPFYLMDEVDAHLDAQNTERLSQVLLERSKDNQIIMVTLKDSTITKVGLIYGVYSKNGVSQVVKYRYPNQLSLAEITSVEGK
ncbi:MAG TPA: chromosome segregation SMC family protein [Nitrososphaeraceae archaeon]|nr:chromosome segregation SMC family protein [Nitrososphaeraceae archaeon]